MDIESPGFSQSLFRFSNYIYVIDLNTFKLYILFVSYLVQADKLVVGFMQFMHMLYLPEGFGLRTCSKTI